MNRLGLVVVMAVLFSGGCFDPVPTEGAPCPCATGFDCCAGNVCRAAGQCEAGGSSDGGMATPLSLQTDGVVPISTLLRGLGYPAQLGVVGESVFLLARENPSCDQFNDRGPFSVTRLESAGAWTRTWNTVLEKSVHPEQLAVSTDGVTVVGSGTLSGTTPRGGADAVVIRLNNDGTVAWARQFGSLFDDSASRVLARPGGKVLVMGVTGGALEGQVSQGGDDLFIAQLGEDGTTEWFRQFGSSGNERIDDLEALDDGSLVLSGTTTGVIEAGVAPPQYLGLFLRRMDATGNEVWTKQFPIEAFGDLARWGNGFACTVSPYGQNMQLIRISGDGVMEWAVDAGMDIESAQLSVLDADRVSVHGLRKIAGGAVIVNGSWLETFEEIFTSDAGVSVTAGLEGGWPRQQTYMLSPVVGQRSSTEWLVAGTMLKGNNDILSISEFSAGSSTRQAHYDWKFAGPEYATGLTFMPTAEPMAFGFLQSGAMVTLGKAFFTPCEQGSSAGWLWLTKVP